MGKWMGVVGSLMLAFIAIPAHAEMQQVRDPQGRAVMVPRPSNHKECMANSLKVGYSAAKSSGWCSSPNRRFNRSQ